MLVELPTYTGAITAFRNVRAQMVGVPQEADGVDLDALDTIHQRLTQEGRAVKALYVVPNFQNPTGLLIGLDKRRRLLEWASRRDVLIIEDDPYHELYFEDAATESEVRSIKADDHDGRVIYLSSFSKTLAPGYRVAWIAAPAAVAVKLEMAKQSEDLLTGSLDQRVVHEACRSGLLARQLPKLRQHYRHKRDVMTRALARELKGTVTWPEPKGGFFLWLTLPLSARRGSHDPASGRERRHLRSRRSLLRERRGRQYHAPVVLGAHRGTNRGRCGPARANDEGRARGGQRFDSSAWPGSSVSGTRGGSPAVASNVSCH